MLIFAERFGESNSTERGFQSKLCRCIARDSHQMSATRSVDRRYYPNNQIYHSRLLSGLPFDLASCYGFLRGGVWSAEARPAHSPSAEVSSFQQRGYSTARAADGVRISRWVRRRSSVRWYVLQTGGVQRSHSETFKVVSRFVEYEDANLEVK